MGTSQASYGIASWLVLSVGDAAHLAGCRGGCLIMLAYYAIPVALVYFVRKRREVAFDRITGVGQGEDYGCSPHSHCGR